MVERRHPVYEFMAVTPWPDETDLAVKEIKALYTKELSEGDRIGRSVAKVMMMESVGFSAYLMRTAQTCKDPQVRLLFTFTAGRMAGAFGNPAFAYLNAESIHHTGKPLPIPEEARTAFYGFMDDTARQAGINPEDHEAGRVAEEVDWMMTEQALARMVPTMTALEFIDKYTEMALNRLEDNDFDAPAKEGFKRGKERFHILYRAAQAVIGLT